MWPVFGMRKGPIATKAAIRSLVVTIGTCFLASNAFAQNEIAFFRLVDVSGDFLVRYKQDEWRDLSPNGASNVNTPTWEEELRIQTRSYIYHPAFLTMDIGGGPLLTQYRYESDQGDFDGNDTLFNFNAALNFLSRRPYPTTLYYRQELPEITMGISGRFLAKTNEYGLKGRLLEPLSPIQIIWDAGHWQSQGSGVGASIDENLDRFDLRTVLPIRADQFESIQLDFNWNKRRSSSGSPNLPIQSSIITTSTAELRNNQKIGSSHPLMLRHFLNWRQQVAELPTKTKDAQLGYRGSFEWQPTQSTRFFSNLGYRDADRGEIWSKVGTFSLGASHEISKSFRVAGEGRFSQDEAPGFTQKNSGGRASASYKRPLPFGSLGASVSVALDRVDQAADANTISVLDEPVELVGTIPVDLNFEFVVAGTAVVTNGAKTQTFTEGIDYRLVTIGAVTSIERILAGSILDGQVVLVSYETLAGGTVAYDTQNRSAAINMGLTKWASFYLQIRDQTNDIRSGFSTTALNDINRIGTGVRIDVPLASGWGIGANMEYVDQDEDISPYASRSVGVYLQTATYWRTSARLGFNQNTVDYEKSVEDTDSSGYNFGVTSRLPGGFLLGYDATFRDDVGGTVVKEDWRHSLRLDWGYRQVRFSVRADQSEIVQGETRRETLRIFAELRRRF